MNCRIFLLTIASLALTACHYQRASFQPEAGGDTAERSLAEAAHAVNQSLRKLNEIKRASLPKDKKLLNISRYAMPGKTTVDWSGPIQPLLSKIAKASNYRLVVLGKTPAIPVLATVYAVHVPTVYVLRDIDLQAGAKANLRVSTKKRILELRYHKV